MSAPPNRDGIENVPDNHIVEFWQPEWKLIQRLRP